MKRSSCASGRGYVPSCSIGFWVASTKKGDGKEWVWPAAVTWCSCIARSRAACVLGGVRFTSSASTMFANTGPRTNRKLRLPVLWSSSMISVPVISEGMRSGVNWMRENFRSSVCATVCTIRVLARPGTPNSRAWPPENTAVRMPSSTSRWPTMRRPTWASRSARARERRSNSSTSPWGRDAGCGRGDGPGAAVGVGGRGGGGVGRFLELLLRGKGGRGGRNREWGTGKRGAVRPYPLFWGGGGVWGGGGSWTGGGGGGIGGAVALG